MSGRFAGRTKDWCFKAFTSCDDEILDGLAMPANDNDLASDASSQLEHFVDIPVSIKNPDDNRKRSFVGFSTQIVQPKEETFHQLLAHWTARAHYIAMIWSKADENHARLPAPAELGWTFDASSTKSLHTRLPAPAELGWTFDASSIKSLLFCSMLIPPAPAAVLHNFFLSNVIYGPILSAAWGSGRAL